MTVPAASAVPAAEGRVESVNVAVVRTTADWMKKSRSTGIDKRPVAGPVLLAAAGVEGDTICDLVHHGGPDQAVYAYSCEDLAFWSVELGMSMLPGGVGENLTLSGVDCSGAVLGERWQVGTAVLQVRAPRIPCRVFAGFRGVPDLVRRFVAARRPGSYLAVVQPGTVAAGATVRVLDRPAHGVTVARLSAAITGERSQLPAVAAAREHFGAREQDWLDRTLGVTRV